MIELAPFTEELERIPDAAKHEKLRHVIPALVSLVEVQRICNEFKRIAIDYINGEAPEEDLVDRLITYRSLVRAESDSTLTRMLDGLYAKEARQDDRFDWERKHRTKRYYTKRHAEKKESSNVD